MIKEVIVVEGKDDVAAVKKAVKAEVIITNGLGITKDTLNRISLAQKNCGVIVLTDPDYPGEKIRKIIDRTVPGCRHAYLYFTNYHEGKKGVEDATPEEIEKALKTAKVSHKKGASAFTLSDLLELELIGCEKANYRRRIISEIIGIGQCNAKQFLQRLNNYGITREAFAEALMSLESDGIDG